MTLYLNHWGSEVFSMDRFKIGVDEILLFRCIIHACLGVPAHQANDVNKGTGQKHTTRTKLKTRNNRQTQKIFNEKHGNAIYPSPARRLRVQRKPQRITMTLFRRGIVQLYSTREKKSGMLAYLTGSCSIWNCIH